MTSVVYSIKTRGDGDAVSMSDKTKYWLDLAKEDIDVAQILLSSGKLLYCGFITHLAVEKALKGKIESTGETPLKIHNLIRLAETGGLLTIMTEDQKELLKTLNPLQIEARYPEYKQNIAEMLTAEKCADMIAQAKEMVAWIGTQL